MGGPVPAGPSGAMSGGAIAVFVRLELRRRLPSYLVLALVVALGIGVSIGSLVLAHRTDHAYGDYVARAHVNQLVINPSLASEDMEAAIRSFDGVRSVHSNDLILAVFDHLDGGILQELATEERTANLQVLGSPDGRFTDVDQPTVVRGRLPTGDHEIFVSADYLAEFEELVGRPIDVGSVIDTGFIEARFGGPSLDPDDPIDPNQFVRPMAVEPLRVSGIGHLSDEVLPDDLYPRQRLVVSADVAARYACPFVLRPDMDGRELNRTIFRNCSTQYRYYSLELEPGTTTDDIRQQFQDAQARLEPLIPAALTEDGAGYFYISQERADLDQAVHQTTRPAVTALTAFALIAALATLIMVSVAVARLLRRLDPDQFSLFAMGATTSGRLLAVGGAAAVVAVAGVVLSLGVAAVVSLIGPLGSVRSVGGARTVSLPLSVVVPAAVVAAAALLVLAVTLPAYAAARRATRPVVRSRSRGRRFGMPVASNPARALGIRAVAGPESAGAGYAVLAGCVVAVVVVVASVLFGSNLASVVRTPARYGWPWQVAVLTGGGYGSTDGAAVSATLAGRPEVVDHTVLAFDPAAQIRGRPVPSILAGGDPSLSPFPVVEGRAALRPGEVVLGRQTANELDIHVGDPITVGTNPFGPIDAEVVGLAVLPNLGPFVADRASLGRGAFLSVDIDPAEFGGGFVGIRLARGVDPEAFERSIHAELLGWDTSQSVPVPVAGPVRPPEIVDVDEMRQAPIVMAGILALALVVGLALAIGVSVRDRRRELAMLRVLGFRGRDLDATVRWQAVASMLVGLLVGIPLGIVAGQLAWRRFALQVGLSAGTDIPWLELGAVAAAALVLALAAATLPGRAAGRIAPGEALRTT